MGLALGALLGLGGAMAATWPVGAAQTADEPAPRSTSDDGEAVAAILEDHCFECHGLGAKKGGVSLDGFGDASSEPNVWLAVLRNVRSGIMPPAGKPPISAEERAQLERWIKHEAFRIDPANLDPGRVTMRRLNRSEYRNTIRELLGVSFDTNSEFPADDTGHGFDNNGDVLTISPLLLEKYLAAASSIIGDAVPQTSRLMAERRIPGRKFRIGETDKEGDGPPGAVGLSYYEPGRATLHEKVGQDGRYQIQVDLTAAEKYIDGVNDANRCEVRILIDDEQVLVREFSREDNKTFPFTFERDWSSGPHRVTVEVKPLTPDEKQTRSLAIRLPGVLIKGPMDPSHWVQPSNYEKFFPRPVPEDDAGRRQYARELLGRFADRAFRRPVDDAFKDRLAALAESIYTQKGQTFEQGVSQGMVAVLSSPRFLFREERSEPGSTGPFEQVDEYTLASRLSFFLWSSMPDAELFDLASRGELRKNLTAQVDRMLADKRASEFYQNFVGQWLQARDVESVPMNGPAVMARDATPDPDAEKKRARFRELNRRPQDELTEAERDELKTLRGTAFNGFRRFAAFEFSGDLRRAMRRETEMTFEHVIRENRPLLELLASQYTFLNEKLARHYGIEGVSGENMRLVELPADSHRGGLLTQGTVLTVTSNPDRTSPVKRGLYILENILGSPPAPPPPDIPALEESTRKVDGRIPTIREAMVIHRSQPSCMGCHARMDPLGLVLENYNALGIWREKERTDPIDASGTLLTGEPFQNYAELKTILIERHRDEFYHCLTEKLLTFALGRGLDYHDVETVDQIVSRIEAHEGKSSALISGIIESPAFQKMRRVSPEPVAAR